MTIQEYLRSTAGKRITVIGIGVSNRPLLRLLAGAGARLTARDKKTAEQLGAIVPELQSLGVELVLGEGYLDGLEGDIIFRTPGLRPDHPALLAAKARGAEITSEMEVFFAVCPCMQIAVTGSDGKTTTTTLIAEMLKAAGKTVWLGGNIGTPLLDQAERMRPEDVAVLELSSFQLMSMEQAPHIAVITNLSPNHLDVHKDMDEYVSAKCNIFRRQGPEDVLVLAGGMSMLELVRNASQSVAAADAPPELRLAAQKVTLTDAAAGSAVEVLYRMVRDAENLA